MERSWSLGECGVAASPRGGGEPPKRQGKKEGTLQGRQDKYIVIVMKTAHERPHPLYLVITCTHTRKVKVKKVPRRRRHEASQNIWSDLHIQFI